ncbi:hypothetical protein Hanom_Chr16g01516801 [Helianthus anomalus]
MTRIQKTRPNSIRMPPHFPWNRECRKQNGISLLNQIATSSYMAKDKCHLAQIHLIYIYIDIKVLFCYKN